MKLYSSGPKGSHISALKVYLGGDESGAWSGLPKTEGTSEILKKFYMKFSGGPVLAKP
jgi:hypothetical protein